MYSETNSLKVWAPRTYTACGP